tara:strand:+ start:1053 stop:1388 length:336 start_codon:yes stop_codon:yes gene_type:complete
MANEKVNVPLIQKVKSLGASFYKYMASVKEVNKVVENLNDTGLVEIIIATAVSTTTDFGNLKIGDRILVADAPAGTPASTTGVYYLTCAAGGTLPAAAVIGNIYIVMRPAA